MKRIIYSLSIIMALLPGSVRAQNAQQPIALSLKDAMEYAVKNNYSAKNARLDVLLQQARNSEITGSAYPQINGTGQFTQYVRPLVQFFPGEFAGAIPGTPPVPPGTFIPVTFTPNYNTSAGVQGSQILFNGSVLVALQARNTIIQLSEQNARLTEEDLRYNVERAYYSFAIANRQYDILKGSLANARSILHEVIALQQAGFAEKIEVDRTQVQVNNLATDSIRIGSLLTVSEQLLKYNMGMELSQPIYLTDTNIEDKIETARGLVNNSIDYSNRTDYNLTLTQLRLNEFDLKRHKLSGLPSLVLIGNANYTFATNEFKQLFELRQRYVFSVFYGLQLNVPIFDGLQRRNRVKQARFNIEKTQNNLENLKLGIDFQTAQSQTTLKNSLLALANQERNMQLASSVIDLAQRKYKEGVGSNLEVSQAQTELLQAQNNYFQSLLEVINAQAEVQRALGQFK